MKGDGNVKFRLQPGGKLQPLTPADEKKRETGMLLATFRDAVLTAMQNRPRATIQTRM